VGQIVKKACFGKQEQHTQAENFSDKEGGSRGKDLENSGTKNDSTKQSIRGREEQRKLRKKTLLVLKLR